MNKEQIVQECDANEVEQWVAAQYKKYIFNTTAAGAKSRRRG